MSDEHLMSAAGMVAPSIINPLRPVRRSDWRRHTMPQMPMEPNAAELWIHKEGFAVISSVEMAEAEGSSEPVLSRHVAHWQRNSRSNALVDFPRSTGAVEGVAMGCLSKAQKADLKPAQELDREMKAQMERARVLAEVSYSMAFANDAALIKFLLDRLERVEKANTTAYNTIRALDWAL